MCRKLIYLVSFVLVPAYFAGQVGAAPMGMDGYADRVIVRNDGNDNAVWYVDASGSGGFGDGIADRVLIDDQATSGWDLYRGDKGPAGGGFGDGTNEQILKDMISVAGRIV